ncbi:MAG: RICIN domain-containing protein [Bacteroidales bacterium]|nr:RICIN domain-containing protein [Bacteroidales bacterium]
MKKLFSFLFLLLLPLLLMAAPLKNMPVRLTLPNGEILNCLASGDEFFNYLHDADGYSIVKGDDGYYYYALRAEGNNLIPSDYKVGTIDPKQISALKSGSLISGATYENLRKTSPYLMPDGTNRTVARSMGQVAASSTYLIGNTNVLVYYIKLADDDKFTKSYAEVNSLYNSTSKTTASVKGYYEANSYNNFSFTAHFIPGAAPNGAISYYEDKMDRAYMNSGNNPPVPESSWAAQGANREHCLLRRAVEWANVNAPLPDGMNVDKDNDGNVDNACFIIAGAATTWGSTLWPHAWSLYSTNAYVNTTTGQKKIGNYILLFGDWLDKNVVCHELNHTLGDPDYYRYDDMYPNGSPVTGWDPMENNNNVYTLTFKKNKYQNVWLPNVPEITESGTYTLKSVLSPDSNCYKIASPYDSKSYFMLEYRQKKGLYEGNVPGNGLIVYRIDTRYSGTQNGPYKDELFILRPGGTLGSGGDASKANFSSAAGVDRPAINDYTNPPSYLQDGGFGGLDISDISAATSDSSRITFKVTIRSKKDSVKPALGPSYTNYRLMNGLSLGALTYLPESNRFSSKQDLAVTDGMFEKFKIKYVSNSKFQFLIYPSDNSNLCLMVDSLAAADDSLCIGAYNSSDKKPWQLWEFTYGDGAGYMIRNVNNPDLYLTTTTAGSRPVVVRKRAGTKAQFWYLKEVSGRSLAGEAQQISDGGYYKIKSKSTGLALQPSGTADGDVIQQMTASTDDAQLWKVSLTSDSMAYVFTNVKTGKVLDVRSFKILGVQLFQSNNVSEIDYGQQFELLPLSNGSYGIRSRLTAYGLDNSGKTKDKGQVIQYTYQAATNANQQWVLEEDYEKNNLLKNGTFETGLTNWTVSTTPTAVTSKTILDTNNPLVGKYAHVLNNSGLTLDMKQYVSSLPYGKYVMTAYVRSSGGFVMYAKDTSEDDSEVQTAIGSSATNGAFVKVSIPVIVTGSAQIGFKGTNTGSSWIDVDNASFRLVELLTDERIEEVAVDQPLFNAPNPFEDETVFTYSLTSASSSVRLSIYNTDGRLMDSVTGLPCEQGVNNFRYSNPGLTGGIYYGILTIQSDSEIQRQTVKILVK